MSCSASRPSSTCRVCQRSLTSALLEVQGQIGHYRRPHPGMEMRHLGTNSIRHDDVTAVRRVLHDFAIDGNLYGTAGAANYRRDPDGVQ